MEVILFGSLYPAIEVLIFYVHFLWKNFLFAWCDRSGVPFLQYEKGFRRRKFRGPRGPFFLSSCWVAFGRPFYLWTVLPGVPRHWRVPPASGGHPPRLIPPSGLVWVYCLAPEAPQKGECRRGRRYFWPCRTRVGFGPATGPTLKTALCHIRALVGRNDKYRGPRRLSRNLCMALDLAV